MANKRPRDDRWYLPLMAPNTKGEKFAWLDPTSIYINATAFTDLLDDMIEPLKGRQIDVVGGQPLIVATRSASLPFACRCIFTTTESKLKSKSPPIVA